MNSAFLKTIKNTIKYWYIPLLIGILFIILCIVSFTAPLSYFLTLSLLFALSFLFGGLLEIIFSIANKHQLKIGDGPWPSELLLF